MALQLWHEPVESGHGCERHVEHLRGDGHVRGTVQRHRAGLLSLRHHSALMIGQEWFRSPGFIHSVVLSGLQPATAYFYQCGNDEDGWSQVFQFTSPFVY